MQFIYQYLVLYFHQGHLVRINRVPGNVTMTLFLVISDGALSMIEVAVSLCTAHLLSASRCCRIDFKHLAAPNLANSAVLRMLQEEEERQRGGGARGTAYTTHKTICMAIRDLS